MVMILICRNASQKTARAMRHHRSLPRVACLLILRRGEWKLANAGYLRLEDGGIKPRPV